MTQFDSQGQNNRMNDESELFAFNWMVDPYRNDNPVWITGGIREQYLNLIFYCYRCIFDAILNVHASYWPWPSFLRGRMYTVAGTSSVAKAREIRCSGSILNDRWPIIFYYSRPDEYV